MQQSNPKHLKNILLKNCLNNRRQLDGFSLFKHPEKYFRVFESQVDLDQKMSSMTRLIKERLTDHKARVSNFENLLEAFSPLKVLDRGYTLVKNKKGGVIMSVKDVDNSMTLIFNDGETNVQKLISLVFLIGCSTVPFQVELLNKKVQLVQGGVAKKVVADHVSKVICEKSLFLFSKKKVRSLF